MQILNYFSELGPVQVAGGSGGGRGPKMKTLVPLTRRETHEQNIMQPHRYTCHQQSDEPWIQLDSDRAQPSLQLPSYFIFSLNIKESTFILRDIISSSTIIVNEISLLFQTSVNEELCYTTLNYFISWEMIHIKLLHFHEAKGFRLKVLCHSSCLLS